MSDEGLLCESCDDPALFVLHMTNSVSMDNLWFGCRGCADYVMRDWMWGGDSHNSDVEGWEIRKL